MSAQALIDDLKSRINPLYADQRGTESYERRQCAEALEKMLAENARLSALADRWNTECDAMREDNKRLAAELAAAQSMPDVDWLANVIRATDGFHNKGAGAIAEGIVAAMLASHPEQTLDMVCERATMQDAGARGGV